MMITERKGVRQLQCIFALVVVAVIVVVAVVVVAVVLKSKTFFGQFLFRISRLGNKSVEFFLNEAKKDLYGLAHDPTDSGLNCFSKIFRQKS